MTFRLLGSAIVAALLLPAAGAAQVATMDFSTLNPLPYDPLPQTFGDRAGLDVTNSSRSGFGNTAINSCNSTSHVDLWPVGYSDLSAAAFACANGLVGEFFFAPTAGKQVTLQSLRAGSYPSNGVTGPPQAFSLRVYDTSWQSLFSFDGTLTVGQDFLPNITSSTGLYLQWGTSWNTGVNLITTNVTNIVGEPPVTPPTTVPEPSTIVLMAAGIGALGLFSRRTNANQLD